jgi:RNA polymerase sigma factor (sigma-70 family)
MDEHSDEDLYAAWAAGDPRAGQRLIERRIVGIRRLVASLLPPAEAEDAIQEVFERLARRAREGGEVTKVKAFTAGIARNVVREHLRGRGGPAIDLSERSLADLRPNQSAEIVRLEERRLLLESLHRLPVDDQILLGLRYWERLRTRELAELLGQNHSTVRTRLQRAEAKLQRTIRELADSPEAIESTFGSLTQWAREIRDLKDK